MTRFNASPFLTNMEKMNLEGSLSHLKSVIQSGKTLRVVCSALQNFTKQMLRKESFFNYSHALVYPDRDGKTPLFYASQSGHAVQMSFLLSVFFVSRVEMSPETLKLELPFDQWFNVIARYEFKKSGICIAAAGNQAMRDVMTNEVQTIEGMVTTISAIGNSNEHLVPKAWIAIANANAVRAKIASSKNKRTITSKKKPTLATDKDDEYNYLDTYYDGDDDDDVEDYHHDISNDGMSKVQRATHDLHDIAEEKDKACDAQDIEKKEESHSEAWIGEERESLQNTDLFCIETRNLHLDLEAIKISKTMQNEECDWSLVSDDKESWDVISDVQSVQSFSSSIPFSYKDAILMKTGSGEQVVSSRADTSLPSEQCRKKPAEETVKDDKSNERIYDSISLRDGYKGGRGKGNMSRHCDSRRQRQMRNCRR